MGGKASKRTFGGIILEKPLSGSIVEVKYEIYRKGMAYSIKTDAYALGVVLIKLFSTL